MRRPINAEATEAVGSDSFLDVVTNIVGILIILVMVVGMRARNSPVDLEDDAETDAHRPVQLEIERLASQSAGVEQHIHQLHQQAKIVAQELQLRDVERTRLGLAVAATEQELVRRRGQLDADRRELLDLHGRAAGARSELARIEQAMEAAHATKGPTVEIKAFYTPLSKTVFGNEVHFQLLGGRVAYIPIEELFELAKQETRSQMNRFSELTERVFTVGPKQGFEMRYTIDVVIDPRQGQVAVRSKEWQVVPMQPQLGESVDQALADSSYFRQMLSRHRAGDTAVTLWTYPDSFAEYRTLNAELHRLGYVTAGRPLPAGFPIGGSPRGSKSAAQ
jgi:hypothetical protein